MFKEMIATSIVLCLFGLNAHATPLSFKNHVIFGDSLTDVGNYTTSSNNCIYFNAPITNHTQDAESQCYPHTDQSVLLGLFPNKEDKLRLQQACLKWNHRLFFNTLKSDQNLLKLFKNKHSDSHIYVWNPTRLLADMIKNPTHYGYPEQMVFNTQNSKIQDMHYPTAQITYCGNTAKNAARNPEHYMFYNFIHPTPSVYNIMEQDMMNNAAELQS